MNAKPLSIALLIALCLTMTLSSCAQKSEPLSHQSTQPARAAATARPVAQATNAPALKEVVTQEVAIPPASQPTTIPGSVPTPADNYFQDYGVNPFVETSRDHLSTFAIDVDTASYSVMRRYLADGNLPPLDAVRPEEYINYFDQEYPAPPEVAFGIYADGAPSPFIDDGTQILRFGIQGYRVPAENRKPLVLTFIIDVSGSMADGGRLDLVKRSLALLVDQLRPEDTVGIVAYTSDAFKVLDPISGKRKGDILEAIYTLSPLNSTNAEAGLQLGYRMAMQAYRPEATNRVILCSDGVANTGNTDPEDMLAEVHGYVAEGVTLTAIGVGMGNFNDVLLEMLADQGNGNYAYIDTLAEARKVLVDDLVSTMQVIALDAKVQVDFNPDVVARYRLIGYENRAVADQDFRNDTVDAGEIGAGHAVTALYAVQLKPQAEGRIATIQLRWQDPDTREVTEINGNFNTFDLAPSFDNTTARFQLDVIVAQFAEALRGSPWVDSTTLAAVAEYAGSLPHLLPGDPDVAEFVSLVNRADQIRALGK